MSVQIINREGKPEWAVLPYEEYLALVEQVELAEDIQDYDNAKAALANGSEELIPSSVVFSLARGDNPIRVWREHRKLTQQQLAAQVSISVPYLSQLETGKRTASLDVLTRMVTALKLDAIDDLVN
ncbi:MAG TPA: XRE family transcriptional regulator [Anaerolineaceae bacterium]|nr:XRE family transcriptional regulator [Anaerolineaceae bacterium]